MAKAQQRKPPKRDKITEIIFPIGGLNKSQGFQRQPPYTTPLAMNVRTYDILTPSSGPMATGTRLRGGSRPGLAKTFNVSGSVSQGYQPMGSPSPIQLIDSFTWVFSVGLTQNILISIANATVYYYNQNTSYMVALSGWSFGNTSAPFLQGAQNGLNYYVADYRTGNVLSGNDGSVASTTYTTGHVTAASGGTLTGSGTTWTSAMVGGVIQINGTSTPFTITGRTSNTSITISDTALAFTGQTYNYIISYGFILTSAGTNFATATPAVQATATDGDVVFMQHSAAWLASNPANYSAAGTVQVANGVVTGTGTQFVSGMVGGTITFGTYAEIIQSVTDSAHLTIADPTVALNSGTSYEITYAYAAEANIFTIASVSGSALTLAAAENSQPLFFTSGDTAIIWQIGRMPQQIVPPASTSSAPTIANMSYTKGVLPLGCPLCCTYKGRLVLAGPGEVWYMSRVNAPTDWDTGAYPGDVQRAMTGTTAQTGGLSAPLTALMPHSDQYLLMSGMETISVLNGDPAFGGQISVLSRTVGCIQANAWTTMPDASIVFLSRDGLYSIAAGAQGYPQPISRQNLPIDLLDIDVNKNVVNVEYCTRYRSIIISVTPTNGNAGTHYWYDVTNNSWWPMQYPYNGYPGMNTANMQPSYFLQYNPLLGGSNNLADKIIAGCMDGYLREFKDAATSDDYGGANLGIVSFITLGPLRVGGIGYRSLLTQIGADVDSATGNAALSWAIYADDTCESLVTNMDNLLNNGVSYASQCSGTWSGGLNTQNYCRAYGIAHAIVLNATSPWAIEGIRLLAKPGGRIL